jgi:hypothetical protein
MDRRVVSRHPQCRLLSHEPFDSGDFRGFELEGLICSTILRRLSVAPIPQAEDGRNWKRIREREPLP